MDWITGPCQRAKTASLGHMVIKSRNLIGQLSLTQGTLIMSSFIVSPLHSVLKYSIA